MTAGAPLAPLPLDDTRALETAPALASRTGVRFAIAGALLVALVTAALVLSERGQTPIALSVVFGGLVGIVLQRARFCFFCMYREWLDDRDPRGLLGLLAALAVGVAGYSLVFGAWLPDATTGRLPPDAFIGPVSVALVAAGLAFGAGMAISGSCVSAHLYRLGEGSPTAPFALIGTVAGFALGYVTWTDIYLHAIAEAPAVWLPQRLGYGGALIVTLGALAAIAALLLRSASPDRRARPAARPSVVRAVLIERWPAWIGGVALGVIGAAAYLRVAPLGVTAELGGLGKTIAMESKLVPDRLPGLDTLRGCVAVARRALLSPNGAFVLSLIVAALAAAVAAGQFAPAWPKPAQIGRGLVGGVLLGWGAMTGLGCTIGTLLSGIMAGALSGWIFGAAVFAGVTVTLWAGRRVGLLPRR